jgi:hypothetical protein
LARGTLKPMKSLSLWGAALAMVFLAGVPAAHADEAQAKEIFKAMSDYMAAQQAISFDYDTSFEIVTSDDQKVALASSGSVTLNRPDKLRTTRAGGFANVEMVFDGKTVSMLGKDANLYAQAEAPGTIDNLVDVLRDKFHRPLPGADLLSSDVNGALMPLVTGVKDLGSGVIRGQECDHLAFRTAEVDWQIWIAQGDRPYPCRFVVTTKDVTGWPQYTVDVRNFKTGAEVAADDFVFKAPAGAQKLKEGEFPDVDELPAAFAPK